MLADLDSRDLGFRHDGAWPSAGIAAGTAAATRPGFESELSVWQFFCKLDKRQYQVHLK